jgi:glycine/D-amino acid oxidase-like deaminating enzyme
VTSGSRVLTETYSFDPYWWRAAPHKQEPAATPLLSADVAIIGSGITGLVAALHLARGGRQVTVFEAQEPGYGASTRNAGYVGRTLKHGFAELVENHGLPFATQIYGELMEAFLAVKGDGRKREHRLPLSPARAIAAGNEFSHV